MDVASDLSEPTISVDQTTRSPSSAFRPRGTAGILWPSLMKCQCLLTVLAAGMAGWVYSQTAAKYLDARASDPKVMGWMQGAPPPADKVIRFEDESFFRFPQTRWTFSHW